MSYFEQSEIVKDICMSYGFKYGEWIDFYRWNPEDEKTVRDFMELEHESAFAQIYCD